MSDIGGRQSRIDRGGCVAAVIACLVTLPFALLFVALPATPAQKVLLVFVVCIAIGCIAYPLGIAITSIRTSARSNVRVVVLHAVLCALIGIVGGLACFELMALRSGGPSIIRDPAFLLTASLFTMPGFALAGAIVGLRLGLDAVARQEERLIQALKQARTGLEAAVVEKFGSLDDAGREMIRSWDSGRVAEAWRRLPDASHPDEL
jgi:hypothetical protein